MLTLTIFRHAKSDRCDPRLKDVDRPLAKRGRLAAPRIGAYLATNKLIPEFVLCSPSVRTRETARLAFSEVGARVWPEIQYDDSLYLASMRTLLARIQEVPSTIRHLMLIGHNPGLHMLAIDLIGEGDPAALNALAEKLPTAALVVIVFDVRDWADLKSGTGRLSRFITPRMLGEGRSR